MLALLAKDFKLIFASGLDLKRRIISTIFSAIVLLGVVAVETFIFSTILTKIKDYNQAPIAFLTLFLFIVSVLMIVMGVFNAKKLFFNEKDIEQLTKYPISNEEVIFSKLIFLFILQYMSTFLFTFPIFISYGIIFRRSAMFFYTALFYPIMTFLFEGGIILLLVYPFKMITDFLKKHLIVQFVVSMVIIFGLCLVYGKVLDLFVQIVATNNLNALLSTDFINFLIKMRSYFFPVNFITDYLINGRVSQLLPFFCISLGVLSLGLSVSVIAFNYFRNMVIHDKTNYDKKHELKTMSLNKALLKKELILIFKDSNYIFSFTGLLIVQPLLAYLVVYSLNMVFESGTFSYYISMLPNFIPLLDILLVMLFTLVINQGANTYIQMEDKNIRLMKSIPVSPFRQLFIKAILPFTLSVISLIITLFVLWVTKTISIRTLVFGFILTLVLLVIFDIVSMYEELKIRRNKPRSTFVSTMYSYLLPITYFFVTVVSSFFGASIFLVYLLGLLVFVLLGIPFVINFKKRVKSLFMDLEVVN